MLFHIKINTTQIHSQHKYIDIFILSYRHHSHAYNKSISTSYIVWIVGDFASLMSSSTQSFLRLMSRCFSHRMRISDKEEFYIVAELQFRVWYIFVFMHAYMVRGSDIWHGFYLHSLLMQLWLVYFNAFCKGERRKSVMGVRFSTKDCMDLSNFHIIHYRFFFSQHGGHLQCR